MTEKKTEIVRKKINKAIELYDKGNWNEAIDLLTPMDIRTLTNSKEVAEIEMHIGWNYWKKNNKELAVSYWEQVRGNPDADSIIQSSVCAGLGIYYAEKGDKERALYHAKLAQELLPENANMNQAINLNACGISLAKIGELKKAEKILQKVAKINEQLERSPDSALSKKAKHQRAKNGYNLASLIYLPQGRWDEAIRELYEEIIPRYTAVGAETDLAAAYHRMAEAYEKMAETGDINSKTEELEMALAYEKVSLNFWQKHSDDPKRAEIAGKNITNIINKIENLKQ